MTAVVPKTGRFCSAAVNIEGRNNVSKKSYYPVRRLRHKVFTGYQSCTKGNAADR